MCANQRQESKKEADLGFHLIEKYLLVTTIKKLYLKDYLQSIHTTGFSIQILA